jgi:hypothetical protein
VGGLTTGCDLGGVTNDEAFRFDGFAPRTDGLFLKLSYLFRN